MAERRLSSLYNRFYFQGRRARAAEPHPSILDDAMFRHPTPPLDRSRRALDIARDANRGSSDSMPGLLLVTDSDEEEAAQYLPTSDSDSDQSENTDEGELDREESDDDDDVIDRAGLSFSAARRRVVRAPSPVSLLSSRNTEEDGDLVPQIGARYFSPSPSPAPSDISRNDSLLLHEQVSRLENQIRLTQHLFHARQLEAESERRGRREVDEDDMSSTSSSPRFVHSGIQLLVDRNAYSAEEFFSDSGEDIDDSSDSGHSFLAHTNTEPATPWSTNPSHNDALDALFSTRTPFYDRSEHEHTGSSSSSSASVASAPAPTPSPSESPTDKPALPNTSGSGGADEGKESVEEQDFTGRGGWSGAKGYTCPLCLECEGELSSAKCGHVFCTA